MAATILFLLCFLLLISISIGEPQISPQSGSGHLPRPRTRPRVQQQPQITEDGGGKWQLRHTLAKQLGEFNTSAGTGKEYLPEKQFILIEASAGLANRIRVLNAFMWVVMHKYGGIQIVMIWDLNNECPGHFLDIFNPVPGIVFITSEDRAMFSSSPYLVREYESSNYNFGFITHRQHDFPKSHTVPDGKGKGGWERIKFTHAERQMLYSLTVKKVLLDQVYAYVRTNNMCSCTGAHVRMTDHNVHVNTYSYWTFINASEPCSYLMTDFPNAQKYFMQEFPQKLKYFTKISQHYQLNDFFSEDADETDSKIPNSTFTDMNEEKPSGEEAVASSTIGIPQFQNRTAIPKRYRYTTLSTTMIDVLIAAHTSNFKPSLFSSLSEMVEQYRPMMRRRCESGVANGVANAAAAAAAVAIDDKTGKRQGLR